jgi:ribosomal protein S2
MVNDSSDPVAIRHAQHTYEKQLLDPIGSVGRPVYRPHELLSNPPRPEDITLELLLASGAHLGHATQLWHPGNSQYIFGVRGTESGDPIHIISLDVTASYLRRACKVVEAVAENGGVILFVGTRNGQARVTVKAASMAQGCHLFSKWIPGSITNGQQILGNCAKKVVNKSDQEVDGFDDQLDDYAAIKPDLVVCLNPVENYVLLRECGQHGIPTIGIVDTDCNPTWVTYPIPANDDSPRCVQVIAGSLGRAGQAGHKKRLAKGVSTYKARHNLKPPKGGVRPKAQQGQSSAVVSSNDHEIDMERDLAGVPVDQFERDQELFALLGGQLQAAAKPSELDSASEDAQDAAAEAFSLEDNADTARIISEVQQSESGSQSGNVETSSSMSQSVQEDDVELDIREEDYVQLQGHRSEEVTKTPEEVTNTPEEVTFTPEQSTEDVDESDDPSLSQEEIEALVQAEMAKRMAARSKKKSDTSKKPTATPAVVAPPKAITLDASEFDIVSAFDDDVGAAPVVSQTPEKQSPTITTAPSQPAAAEPVPEAAAASTSTDEPSATLETKQEEKVDQSQGTIEFASDEVAASPSAPAEAQQKTDAAQKKAANSQGTIEFASDHVAANQSEPTHTQEKADAAQETTDQSQGTVEFASDQVAAAQSAPAQEQTPVEKDVPSQTTDEIVKEASKSSKLEAKMEGRK